MRQAKTDALREHRDQLETRTKKKKIEEQIVARIESLNPTLGHHLANNMKDYILHRMKEDFDKK